MDSSINELKAGGEVVEMAAISDMSSDQAIESANPVDRLERLRNAASMLAGAVEVGALDSTDDRARRVADALATVGDDFAQLQIATPIDVMPELVSSFTADQQELIISHTDLVEHVVFKVAVHFPKHVDRDELVAAGRLGLVEAAMRYDERRGVEFERFAAQRIRGAVLDSVRRVDWAPRSVRRIAREVGAMEQKLATEYGYPATERQLAEAMEMSTDELANARASIHTGVVLSLERDLNRFAHGKDEENIPLIDSVVDDHAPDPVEPLETRELHALLHDAISLLPDRHRFVIEAYFLQGCSSAQIAEELKVTESRISQLRSDALDMLKSGLEAQYTGEPVTFDVTKANGRVERRLGRYAADVANRTSWKERIA